MSEPTTPDQLRPALRTATLRLLPLLGLCYVINTLDRVNVGYAALTMNADLGLSTAAFGFGAGLFFIGYFVFEIPSNLALHRIGARLWIARIMVTWGLLATAMAFIQGEISFYVVRFLLGVAEAGFVPGVILYLTYWFPRAQRTQAMATFFLAVPIATIVGAPLSTALIQYADGVFFGAAGWRAMFFLEGVPAVIVGLLLLVLLPNRPRDARWLAPEQAEALESRLAQEDREHVGEETTTKAALTNPKVLGLAVMYFGIVFGFYALAFFLPSVIAGFQEQFGVTFSIFEVGLVAAVPSLVAAVGMLLWARRATRVGAGGWTIAAPTLVAAVAIALALQMNSPFAVMICLSVCVTGVLASIPVFWQLPNTLLVGVGAAAGIAFINSISNLAGFAGPYLVGWLADLTGSFQPGMLTISGFLVLSGLLALRFRHQQVKDVPAGERLSL